MNVTSRASASLCRRVYQASKRECARASCCPALTVSYTTPFSSGHSRWFHATNAMHDRKRDYYETLGISRDASKNDIKKKYYQLAKKYHPDTNKDDPNAAKKFAEATEAWDILGDEEKRSQYDTFGHAGVDESGGFDPSGFGGGGGGGGGFEDLFSQMFGGQQQQRAQNPNRPQRGSDVQVGVRLSFMEAVSGTTRDLELTTNATCGTCDGSGSKPGTKRKTCTHCRGSGVEVQQQGFFHVESPCRHCRGEGSINPHPCGTCHGQGTVRKRRTVTVTIPAGVDTGLNLRLAHQGEAGSRGGPAGHLYVQIEVASDPFFRREGSNVHVDVPISVAQAILGGTVTIPTLKGQAELKIPAGTQPDTTLKMAKQGLRAVNSTRVGAQLVTLKVQIPKNLSAKQRELIQAFEDEMALEAEKGCHGFTQTVRETIDRIKKYLQDDKKTA